MKSTATILQLVFALSQLAASDYSSAMDCEVRDPPGECASESVDRNETATFRLGFTTSLSKVFPHDYGDIFAAEGSDTASLSLARNESEALQLVILATEDLAPIKVQPGPLRSADGASIPAEDVQVQLVGYVNLPKPRKPGSPSGWIPDPLLPNRELKLRQNQVQAYLITVRTHETTAAGNYRGHLDIDIGGKPAARAELNVHVWNFALPRVSRFKTTNFADWATVDKMWPERTFSPETRRPLMEALADLGFRNRLPPGVFFANGLRSWNWKGKGDTAVAYPTHDGERFNRERTGEMLDFMLARGANHFFLAVTADIYKIPAASARRQQVLIRYLQEYRQYLQERKLLSMAYVYNIDEVWGEESAQHAHDIYSLIKSRVGGDLRVMQNSNENNAGMFKRFLGYFDAFDINLGFYDIHRSDKYRQKYSGDFKDFWWNVNLWPDSHPNLFLEYPLLDARIIGPMSFRFNMQGFEYWQLFSASSMENYEPIDPANTRVKWNVNEQSLDGCLVYPGKDMNIYSSLRFESFRDGMEDQEYLYLLRELAPSHPLLQVPVVQSLEKFTNEPATLLDFRRQLAEAIEQAQR